MIEVCDLNLAAGLQDVEDFLLIGVQRTQELNVLPSFEVVVLLKSWRRLVERCAWERQLPDAGLVEW